ncbi:hypothetical protein, partial [Chitinimonas sp. BJB300]|uniref:hypothetical protein n=1 Tax=Chitinimonas sp. BJB300 TaxID=1559339 RepID=UPI0016435624
IALGDSEGREAAQRRLKEWNATNPDTPVQITRTAISRRVKEIRMSKAERIRKRVPKELR